MMSVLEGGTGKVDSAKEACKGHGVKMRTRGEGEVKRNQNIL